MGQNYARWQEKMINELPENATTKQFIANQAEFLEMHTRGLQERLNLNPSQVRRIKINFEDYVGRHWGVFDPSQNTTSTIANRLSEQIEGMADTLVKQAASVGIGSLADERFEAVATNPDYASDKATQQPLVPVTQVQSDIQELEKVIAEKFGKDPVFTPKIDPVFLSTSPLREHLASTLVKKGDLNPARVLDELGIALTDTGTGFKNKSKKGRLSREVVDSGVANLLRNRIRNGETVTKEELIRVLDHHRGQFSTEIAFGNETEFKGKHYSASGGTSLLTLAKGIGHNSAPTKEAIFEIVSKYNPVLEEGGELGSSPFSLRTGGSHGWASDDIGDQHFWLRGDVLEYADGLKGGSVAEIQSDMGWAESTEHPEYAWLSDMTTTESEEITDIQKRQEIWEQAYEDARVEEIGTIAGDRHIGKGIVDGIRDIASGNFPLTYNDLESWIEPMGRLLSKTNAAFAGEFKALHDKVKESAINRWGMIGFDSVLLDKQPFAKEFGIELTKEDVDIPLSDIAAPRVPGATGPPYGTGLGEALDFSGGYKRALRSRLLKKYPHDFGDISGAFQQGMVEVDQLMLEQYRFALDENASDFYKLFTKEAIAPVLKDYPDLQKLYDLGSTAPTEAELEKLTEFQDQQVDVTALADFPMKKTYPRYGARTLIEKGLAQGWDTVEVSDLPPGQKGSVENYPKAVQELRSIAKKFKLPLETRAATMLTATGEKDRGMAERLVTFYRLDIRPLRALIEAEEFEGFIGLKHGGLVTKAQGAGYNINYGDYGRSYT